MKKMKFEGEIEVRFLNEKSFLERAFFIPKSAFSTGASEFGLYWQQVTLDHELWSQIGLLALCFENSINTINKKQDLISIWKDSQPFWCFSRNE